MSEQVEGHLSLPISYSFNRDKLAQYQNQSIDSKKFHSWVQNDMYRSTYAQHHSPVYEFSFRIHCHPKIHTFQGIVDLSQRTGLKVCTLRLFQTRQRRRSQITIMGIKMDQPRPDLTLLKTLLLTTQKLHPVINTAKQSCKPRILAGQYYFCYLAKRLDQHHQGNLRESRSEWQSHLQGN